MPAYKWLGGLREPIRKTFFTILTQTLSTDEGRRILADSLKGIHASEDRTYNLSSALLPYGDLGASPAPPSSDVPPPLFITARFRSGSTLLWNLFRHVPRCTAFYEPLNERRWFDPSAHGDRIDATHLGVADYWREYEGLDRLGAFYRQHWIDRDLFMNERFWEPNLRAYVQGLIEAAPERAVLQFNRVDFRLAWLRRNFPQARLVHLYRHPRDQWCSSLVDVKSVPRNVSVGDFANHDHFYLLAWARDLSFAFPFLDPRDAGHPYDLFYLIWKLSYLFGQKYSHASFCFETLCQLPDQEVSRLMRAAMVEDFDLGALKRLVVPQKSKWREYADQPWFEERESRCEAILSCFVSGVIRNDAMASGQ